ncbi:MAG: GAF domain-containing protein, partial [Gammaproteobacteria bacterium]|nr:GAF domain-containing protein [Gammaproteobacteria bacterium]
GDITITTQYLHHPALTLGYRLETDGHSVVYSCDHEPFPREPDSVELGAQDLLHVDFLRDADLVIHDAQYTEEEYPTKVGWGHSTADYAVDVCCAAGVKQLALTHHDPTRDDDAVDKIISTVRNKVSSSGQPLQVFGAAEGQKIELRPTSHKATPRRASEPSASTNIKSALADYSILLGPTDSATVDIVAAAAAAENVRLLPSADLDTALKMLETERPSLVMVDEQNSVDHALMLCRKARELQLQAPIVIITDGQHSAADKLDFKIERIVRPFSVGYARTRLKAWVLRTTCRWVRAKMPENEDTRLAALKELAILDTEPEERFDRITREAADEFDVPVALVSLIDHDRQWFKSCIGTDIKEAPRDVAFCAHAIVENNVLIVPDAFLDSRFADNPMVTGESRVRFYAGCPLRLPDGHIMGTLCLIDIRPRHFDDKQINKLKEFAKRAEAQLVQTPESA